MIIPCQSRFACFVYSRRLEKDDFERKRTAISDIYLMDLSKT